LLANIYLNYFDRVWKERCSNIGVLVRFADDYVVLCRKERDAQEALRRINIIMERLGLTMHPDKTKVVNLKDGQAGFDFLGFHCRRVRSWRYHRYYLQYWPRTKAMKAIREKIRTIIGERRHRLNRSLKQVIDGLTPVLRGWRNYFAVGNSTKYFSAVDSYVRERLFLFLSKKHGKSGRGWGERWKDIDFRKMGLFQLTGTIRRYCAVNAHG
jgi:RNA-directed DNA polymerase